MVNNDTYSRQRRFAYVLLNTQALSNDLKNALITTCRIFTPIVASDEEYNFILDITGCAHLFRGEQSLKTQLENKLKAVFSTHPHSNARQIRSKAHHHAAEGNDTSVKIAIAPTVWAAAAMARYKMDIIIEGNQFPQALNEITVDCLALDAAIISSLKELGIFTLGELLKLPRKSLGQRFGVKLLIYLDEIIGIRSTTINNIPEEKYWHIEKSLLSPARTSPHLVKAIELCLEGLCRDLLQECLGIVQLKLSLTGLNKKQYNFSITVNNASANEKKWMQLIKLKLEGFDAGLGIETVSLFAQQCGEISGQQGKLESLYSRKRSEKIGGDYVDPLARMGSEHRINDLADTIATRLGKDSFFRVMPNNSHHPDRDTTKLRGLGEARIYPAMPCGPRPIRVLSPPQRISALALLPDHSPRKIRWRDLSLTIVKADGPERIENEWWRSNEECEPRDYFRLEDSEGRRLWVFRKGSPPQWFLHGVFA